MTASSETAISSDAGLNCGRAERSPKALVARFTPSFTDCLFASLLIWLFATGSGWAGLLADGDTGWHIRAGEYMLQTHSVPTQDLFSFSKPGAQWFAWEWLADVVFAALHSQWHLKGVVLLTGVLIALAGTLVFRHMLWRGSSVFVSLVTVLLCVGASSIHYLARPHIFTLLLLPVCLWLLDRDRRSPGGDVWLLVPITAIWVNLHGGFLALLVCLGLVSAGCGVQALLGEEQRRNHWRQARRYAAMFAACLFASLANPYGYRLHTHIITYLNSSWIREVVQEFQAPTFRSENLLHYEILLFAALIVAGSLLAKKRIPEALLLLFWAHASLASVRHVPVFAVVSAPLLAAEISVCWKRWSKRFSHKSVPGILAALDADLLRPFQRTTLWPFLLVIGFGVLPPASAWPSDFPSVKFPVALVDRHAEQLASSRVFTSDQWADYLIYRSYPNQRVFFDGRSDFYGQAVGDQYVGLAHGRPQWHKLLQEYEFDAVLIPPEWPLAALLHRQADWGLVDETRQAVLFTRDPD